MNEYLIDYPVAYSLNKLKFEPVLFNKKTCYFRMLHTPRDNRAMVYINLTTNQITYIIVTKIDKNIIGASFDELPINYTSFNATALIKWIDDNFIKHLKKY